MADAKISALTAASALAGTEVAPVVQTGATVKATIDQIKTYVAASQFLSGATLNIALPMYSSVVDPTSGMNTNGAGCFFSRGAVSVAAFIFTGLSVSSTKYMGWSPDVADNLPPDALFTRSAAAVIHLGDLVSATPVNQTLGAQGGTGTNIVGANLTVRAGIGTGNATASKLLLQVTLPVASGTGAQTSTTAISLNNSTATGLQFNGYGAGAITADGSGNLTAASDPSMKHIQREFSPGLAELSHIKPIVYKWREDSGMEPDNEYAGFDARNVRDAIPMATWEGKGGMLSLQDRALLAACVNAINELAAR